MWRKEQKDTKQNQFFGQPSPETEAAAYAVIGAALEVHRTLGSGYLESLYERAMALELEHRGIVFQTQAVIEVPYRGVLIGEHRIDLLVEDRLVVELKAVERIHPAYTHQVLSYLKATGLQLGLLINFNVPLLKDGGVRRIVRTWQRDDPLP